MQQKEILGFLSLNNYFNQVQSIARGAMTVQLM